MEACTGKVLVIIKVYLSNIYRRGKFRHHSVVTPVAGGQIAGLGAMMTFKAVSRLKRSA